MGAFRVAVVLGLALLACAPPKKKTTDPVSPALGDDDEEGYELPPPKEPDITQDAGALGVGHRSSDGGTKGDGGRRTQVDASSPVEASVPDDAGTDDASTLTLCPPIKSGDLAIVELMIASASGSGDRGEWIEVQSTQS